MEGSLSTSAMVDNFEVSAEDASESIAQLKWVHKFRSSDNGIWWWIFGIIVCLSLATRLHKIDSPDHVVWDETHFGKMVGWYINRTFFFDVHPPTGKMLLAAFGYLDGYNATHPFDNPGQKFNETHYLGMRVGCAVAGAAVVPLAFVTVWELTQQLPAATFAAAALLLDTGFITISQYILLDPILLFFIMAAVTAQAKFDNCRDSPFSARWWGWLTLTGAMLAGALSVKMVGLFVVSLVGLTAVRDLWRELGDLSRPLSHTARHLAARALCLLVVPALVYVAAYGVHFAVLSRTGPSATMFSSAFQARLEGSYLHTAEMPRQVCYGAAVTLKNYRPAGVYLHSHEDLYPPALGPVQQQITTHGIRDYNSVWLIKKYNEELPEDVDDPSVPIEPVLSGDLIRLEHETTARNLHSHHHPAPITRRHSQVSGYGEYGVGDSNDVWRIELESGRPGEPVLAVSSVFRLVHYMTGCVLQSHNQPLPDWGFKQLEVTCAQGLRSINTLWNVEENFFARLPNETLVRERPGFFSALLETHLVQFDGNAGFKPKAGEVTSRPWQWPLNYQGQWYSLGDPERRGPGPHKELETRVYLLGNPVVWWVSLACLAAFGVLASARQLADWRRVDGSQAARRRRLRSAAAGSWLVLGWALHYAPFFGMGRILYYHHYFPAQLFSAMLSGVVVDALLDGAAGRRWPAAAAGYLALLAAGFRLFSPLAYGMSGPDQGEPGYRYGHLLWLPTWQF